MIAGGRPAESWPRTPRAQRQGDGSLREVYGSSTVPRFHRSKTQPWNIGTLEPWNSPIDLLFVRSIIIGVNEQLPTFSATERMIVELRTAHDELFGLQMVELSNGRLKRGTVYVTLGRMQDKGFLESRQEALPAGAIGLPRRLYRPTGFAMRALAAWKAAEQIYLQNLEPQEG